MTEFFLRQENARDRMRTAWEACCRILELGRSVKVTVDELRGKRSSEQNAKLWAMLHDVARQVEWPVDGRLQRLTAEEWKDVFSAAWRKNQRVAQGIDGGFVILGERTSRMKVAEMVDLIEIISAFGAERGVEFDEGET